MKNWQPLDKNTIKLIQDFIYNPDTFFFEPHIDPFLANKDGVYQSTINCCGFNFYNIENYIFSFCKNNYQSFENKILELLKEIAKGERMYALEWEGESYSFDPLLPFEKDKYDKWLVPVFSNKGYTFFLPKNFNSWPCPAIFVDAVHKIIGFHGIDIENYMVKNNMTNWKELNEEADDLAWDFVKNTLLFVPSVYDDFSITLPQPVIHYDIKEYFKYIARNCTEKFIRNSGKKFINIFQSITKNKKDRMYALDWCHPCYSFNPFLSFEKVDYADEWFIPIFPDFEYSFFLTKNFKNGIFGDGVHDSISFFGKEMLEQCKDLSDIFYKNDKPVTIE